MLAPPALLPHSQPGRPCAPDPQPVSTKRRAAMRNTVYAVLAGCFLAPALATAQTPETESPADLSAATAADVVPAFVADESTPGQEGPGNRWYGRAEYLLWWLREGRVPPLLTTGSFANGGVLGASDTTVLYGDERLKTRHDDRFNGIRLALGY